MTSVELAELLNDAIDSAHRTPTPGCLRSIGPKPKLSLIKSRMSDEALFRPLFPHIRLTVCRLMDCSRHFPAGLSVEFPKVLPSAPFNFLLNCGCWWCCHLNFKLLLILERPWCIWAFFLSYVFNRCTLSTISQIKQRTQHRAVKARIEMLLVLVNRKSLNWWFIFCPITRCSRQMGQKAFLPQLFGKSQWKKLEKFVTLAELITSCDVRDKRLYC